MSEAPESVRFPSPAAKRAFLRIAEVMFAPMPGGDAFAALGPRDLDFERRFETLVARMDESDRFALEVALRTLTSRVGGLALLGRPVALVERSDLEIERTLLEMLGSDRPLARRLGRLLRSLVGVLVAHPLGPDESGRRRSPVWDAIGYPGPLGLPPDEPRRLSPAVIDRATTWTADVVVVGSGAGGGVAAAVLAEAGLDVVVLERGPYRAERDFTHFQDDAERELYDVRTTSDLGVSILSGRCLGGGTVVNYSTSLRPPEQVLHEWDAESGLRGVFTGRDFSASLDAVSARIGVTSSESRPWTRDRILERCAERAGWDVGVLPRNVRGCAQDERCGFCNFGCRLGAKQSTMRTWLEDAARCGARLVVSCEVERVVLEAGRAVAVRGRCASPNGFSSLTVFARAVVLACGALYTPALLARSGISSPMLGRNLGLHPVTGVWGFFPDEQADPWGGVMQSRIGRDLADLDGRGYGVRIESASVHPVELATLHGWGGAHDYKETLRRYRHWVPVAILLRDRSRGRVRAARWGPVQYEYAFESVDLRHVRTAVEHVARGLAACGAAEIRTASSRPIVWRPAGGERIESFMARADAHGYGANQHTYASFHPSGTARMGADPARSMCDETCRVHGVPGLYVMDASLFPTPSGVNPMLTIEALAHRGARALAASLGRGG